MGNGYLSGRRYKPLIGTRALLPSYAWVDSPNFALQSRARDHRPRADAAEPEKSRWGVGLITVTAIVATGGDAKAFYHGRQFAAWVGLVPTQFSTGGKAVLGQITKRGSQRALPDLES
jgi:hypothetical protein